MIKFYYNFFLLFFSGIAITSCVSYDSLVNFSQGPEFTELSKEIKDQFTITIQPRDILYIKVFASDEESLKPYNLNMGASAGIAAQNLSLSGFLVNQDGEIDYPGLGRLKVAFQSVEQVQTLLVEKLLPFLKDPIVSVRILNFKVSVLGEVRSPGTFTIPEERINIIEALSLAGDLTPYSNRQNILIMRVQNGAREFGRINLYDRKIFESPYFELRQNDIIYVEPSKAATVNVRDPLTEYLTIGASLVSIATLIITLTR